MTNNKARVLVVDDEPSRPAGYSAASPPSFDAHTAPDGEEALREMERNRPTSCCSTCACRAPKASRCSRP